MKLIIGLLIGILLAFNYPDVATQILDYAQAALDYVLAFIQK